MKIIYITLFKIINTFFKGDDLFMDFLRRCLDWDPETRLTPQQAMKHTWLRRRLPRPPTFGGTGDSLNGSRVDNLLMPQNIIK